MSASTLTTRVSTGSVNVSFYPDHQGHQTEVAHQQLTHDQRWSEIAGLLAMGITSEDVLTTGNGQNI